MTNINFFQTISIYEQVKGLREFIKWSVKRKWSDFASSSTLHEYKIRACQEITEVV